MTPVALVLAGLGVALAYSGITGQPFLETLRKTFTTPASQHTRPDTRPIDTGGDIAGGVGGPFPKASPGGSAGDEPTMGVAPPIAKGDNPCRALPVPTNLIRIGQGLHVLAPEAAASHARASSAAGGTIQVTDSFRTFAQQAECHATKPTMCAAAGGSCHEKGLAIDVVEMKNQRVIDALTAEGWVRYDPVKEPWHWAFRVRG